MRTIKLFLIILVIFCSSAFGWYDEIDHGTIYYSTYVKMIDDDDASAKTGLVYTDFTLGYTRYKVAGADITEATGGTATGHTDGAVFEIDSTDQPGVYKIDWPDAAFAAGVNIVNLSVTATDCLGIVQTIKLRDEDTAGYAKVTIKDGTGTGEIDTNAGAVVNVTNTTSLTTNNDKTGYSISGTYTTLDALSTHGDSTWSTATGFSTHAAADIWSVGTRALTDKAGFTISGTYTTLDALSTHGDSTWATATGFSTHAAADIWSVGTRALTDKAGFTISGTYTTLDTLYSNLQTYGDTNWATATGFSTHSAADVWSVGTRALTDKAGFTISGTYTTLDALSTHGDSTWATATGFSTHSAADVWSITMSDISSVPAYNCQANEALNWVFELSRNKTETTSSEITLYKDDGITKLAESDISDDSTTFTRGEYGAPD